MLAGVLRPSGRLTSTYHRALTTTIRPQPYSLLQTRTLSSMSDAAQKKFTFVLYAPDYTDPEAYSRRMSVRQSHLDNAHVLKGNGALSK